MLQTLTRNGILAAESCMMAGDSMFARRMPRRLAEENIMCYILIECIHIRNLSTEMNICSLSMAHHCSKYVITKSVSFNLVYLISCLLTNEWIVQDLFKWLGKNCIISNMMCKFNDNIFKQTLSVDTLFSFSTPFHFILCISIWNPTLTA